MQDCTKPYEIETAPTFGEEENNSHTGRNLILVIVTVALIFGGVAIYNISNMIITLSPDNWYAVHNGDSPPTYTIVDGGSTRAVAAWGNKIYTYPKKPMFRYFDSNAVTVTFADAGTAKIDSYAIIYTPQDDDERLKYHLMWAGIHNVKTAVRSHFMNCAKASAPTMTSIEYIATEKHTFKRLIDGQMKNGLYKMRKIERTTTDPITKKEYTIFATEVLKDNMGKSLVAIRSPFTNSRWQLDFDGIYIVAMNFDDYVLGIVEKQRIKVIHEAGGGDPNDPNLQIMYKKIDGYTSNGVL